MYEFVIIVRGDGDTPDEAWQDACVALSMDPGSTPDAYLELDDNDEPVKTKMTVKEALELIVENQNCPALDHAINYAKYALGLEAAGQLAELRVQLLYVTCNLSKWRTSKAFQVTNEQIRECREVLKAACK